MEGRGKREETYYSGFLTEESSPQTRSEPDLQKEERRERVLPRLPLQHTYINSHHLTYTDTHARHAVSLQMRVTLILHPRSRLRYVAYSNYDYGNKFCQ